MKHVVDKYQVAHLWAHWTPDGEQQDARTSGQGNFYFGGRSIYSYGAHFEIARHCEFKGKKYVSLTHRRHSATTAAHIRLVESAAQHMTVFYNLDLLRDEFISRQIQARDQALLNASRAVKWAESHMNIAAAAVKTANDYIDFFEIDIPHIECTADPETLKALKDKAAAQAKNYREAQKKLKAERDLEQQEKLALWLSGELPGGYYQSRSEKVYMRVQDDEIQTTLGARFPVDHAKRVFKLIARCVRDGTAWQRNGHTEHVGAFQIDSISVDGTVKAGCHTIEFGEIARIAALIGATA